MPGLESRSRQKPGARRGFAALAALGSLALAGASLAGCHPIKAVERRWANRDRPAFRKVTPDVAYEITRDSPDILILDLRRPDEFLSDTGHLLHALNVPLARLPYRLIQLSPYREETFLVYCRAKDSCGEDGIRILVASGFEDAILVEGGIDSWIKKGYRTALVLAGAPDRQTPVLPPKEPTPPPP
jgi:rhodanese-related sulfurtransferase